MIGRLKLTHTAAALASLFTPALVDAQDGGRLTVMVPYFEARDGAEEGFGRQAAEDLRELMEALPFHVAMEEDEMEDQAERFNMDLEDVNCLYAIQLASQINIPILICANYTQGADRGFTLNASIRTVATSDEFALPPITVPRNGRREAAQQIFGQFERYNTLIRSAQICADYASSQQWESALRNCDESLAINPNAMTTLFLRARILRSMERNEEALTSFERVLELDPLNEEALQSAGYLATVTGNDEQGRQYFRRYLEVNPGNVAIRQRIAMQMAEAGDPAGAIEFIQPGLEVDPNSVPLLDLMGAFAFMGAIDAQEQFAAANPNAQGLAPAAAEFYRQAIDAILKVYEVQRDSIPEDRLRNVVMAYMQLEDYPQAIGMAEQIFTMHPDDGQVVSMYADALQRTGRLEDALTALDRLIALQPDNQSAYLRKGTWLIEVKRLEDAVAALSPTAKDAQSADQAAGLVFNEGYTNGSQKQDWAYCIRAMVAAKQIPNISASMRNQLNFWHGLSIFQQAVPLAEPQDLASARATLPRFQEAQQLLGQVGGYPASVGMDMATLNEGLATFIEIQEALIRRGY